MPRGRQGHQAWYGNLDFSDMVVHTKSLLWQTSHASALHMLPCHTHYPCDKRHISMLSVAIGWISLQGQCELPNTVALTTNAHAMIFIPGVHSLYFSFVWGCARGCWPIATLAAHGIVDLFQNMTDMSTLAWYVYMSYFVYLNPHGFKLCWTQTSLLNTSSWGPEKSHFIQM